MSNRKQSSQNTITSPLASHASQIFHPRRDLAQPKHKHEKVCLNDQEVHAGWLENVRNEKRSVIK